MIRKLQRSESLTCDKSAIPNSLEHFRQHDGTRDAVDHEENDAATIQGGCLQHTKSIIIRDKFIVITHNMR
jgi:hypothetical protein